MASITIRNLDESVKRALKKRAAEHGHSMEEEARSILQREVVRENSGADLVERIRQIWAGSGMELEVPPRDKTPWEPRVRFDDED